MTILVGCPINRRARAVLEMAAMLARSGGEDLDVCVVQPTPWMPGVAGADREYRNYVDGAAAAAIEQARADVPPDVRADFRTVTARSTSSGLIAAAADRGATIVAVGSSEAGHFGHITVSSVADRLLHSSPVPVAIAPRGFRSGDGTVRHITLAYTGTRQSSVLLEAAHTLAKRFGVPLRLASFAVRLSPPETARFRVESAQITAEWSEGIRSAARTARDAASSLSETEPEVAIGHGESWKAALDDVEWRPGEVLVVGSSESGPGAAVFLGSRATKIVRYSPVPVLAVPRAAAEDLAQG